jgi:hypothetical protein
MLEPSLIVHAFILFGNGNAHNGNTIVSGARVGDLHTRRIAVLCACDHAAVALAVTANLHRGVSAGTTRWSSAAQRSPQLFHHIFDQVLANNRAAL